MARRIATEPDALVPVGVWDVDPAHSSAEFSVRHMVVATVRGRFHDVQGRIERAHGSRAVSASGAVAVESISTDDRRRDEHLLGPDFLDAATYPAMAFDSSAVEPVGGGRWHVTGHLTIKGVTRPVTFDATVTGVVRDPWGNERVGIEAAGEIDRRDFGLTWSQALEGGGVVVGDTVRISLAVTAVRAG